MGNMATGCFVNCSYYLAPTYIANANFSTLACAKRKREKHYLQSERDKATPNKTTTKCSALRGIVSPLVITFPVAATRL